MEPIRFVDMPLEMAETLQNVMASLFTVALLLVIIIYNVNKYQQS